jgi:hypothetical protein
MALSSRNSLACKELITLQDYHASKLLLPLWFRTAGGRLSIMKSVNIQ